jgi:glutathione S-transferase
MDLYIFPAATTSRAVMALCTKEGLEPTVKVVDITTGAQHQAPYSELNPNHLVPALDDDGFVLTEAAAIMRYLARKSDSSLYPADPRDRARVDELMSWFEANLYKDFGYQLVYPQLMPHHARPTSEGTRDAIEWGRQKSRAWLTTLDQHYLSAGKRYLVGDRLTLADYFGAAIISLGELVRCNFDAYPNLCRWYRTVSADDAWMEVNQAFKGFAESLAGHELVGLD